MSTSDFNSEVGEVAIPTTKKKADRRTPVQRLQNMAAVSDLLLRGMGFERVMQQMIDSCKQYGYVYTEGMLKADIKRIRTEYMSRTQGNVEEQRAIMAARIEMERAAIWRWIDLAEMEPVETITERKEPVSRRDANGREIASRNGAGEGYTRVTQKKRMRRAPVGLFERLADLTKIEADIFGLKVEKQLPGDDPENIWQPGKQNAIPYEDTVQLLLEQLGSGEVIDAESRVLSEE